MAVWRSVILHEFPDDNLENFSSIPGTLTTPGLGVPQLFPLSEDLPTSYFASIGLGKPLVFVPAEPQVEIIGIDLVFDARVQLSLQGDPVPFVRLGDTLKVLVGFRADTALETIDGMPSKKAKITVAAGISTLQFDGLTVRGGLFARIRVNWYTTGQLRLWINDQLVAFANDFSTNQQFAIGQIEVGDISVPAGDGLITLVPWFDLRHLSLRILRRDDTLDPISDRFPVGVPVGREFRHCIEQALQRQQMLMTALREFLATFSRQTTSNWQ